MDEHSARLAAAFAEITVKNMYDWANNKINLAREKKTAEEKQNAYEEIINTLLNEKMEMERIAGEYKNLYENVTISDEEIDHLQKTIKGAVNILSDHVEGVSKHQDSISLLTELISKDAIKTMQLLGFNYKEAIGQPLTEVCASSIKGKLGSKGKAGKK